MLRPGWGQLEDPVLSIWVPPSLHYPQTSQGWVPPVILAGIDWVSPQESTHTQFPERGRYLRLQELSLADVGDYSCTARNAAGSTSVDFHVDIHSECPPPLSQRVERPAPISSVSPSSGA